MIYKVTYFQIEKDFSLKMFLNRVSEQAQTVWVKPSEWPTSQVYECQFSPNLYFSHS